jgi:HAD superfamily hydrolase (TIGR01509 family)
MRAILFDFDGVIADSEVLANRVLAEFITELGSPCTLEDCLGRYAGLRWADAVPLIERDIGGRLPEDFPSRIRDRIHARYDTELRAVEGVETFLARFSEVPRCIASSSSLKGIAHCLEILGLAQHFTNVFSAEQVPRGKPNPDLFLFAAEKMGVAAAQCLVIEDSVNGVKAAVAAGMTAIGLCAGSHIRDGHGARLKDAGAAHIAHSWEKAEDIAAEFLGA